MTSTLGVGGPLTQVSPHLSSRCSWPARPSISIPVASVSVSPVRVSPPSAASPAPQSPRFAADEKAISPRNVDMVHHQQYIEKATSPRNVDVVHHQQYIEKAISPRNVDVVHHQQYIEKAISPRNVDVVHHQQHYIEKCKCDCYGLVDNVKCQLENRFSSLEANLRTRLWEFESRLQTFGDLNSRVSNLEAYKETTGLSVEDAQPHASYSKANIETINRFMGSMTNQMAILSSEIHENSKMVSESQAQASNLEADFEINTRTLKWMECQVFDLSKRINQLGCIIEEAQEKHLLTQHGMDRLAKDLESVRTSQRIVPLSLSEDTQNGIEIPKRTASHETRGVSSIDTPQIQFEGQFTIKSVLEGSLRHEDTVADGNGHDLKQQVRIWRLDSPKVSQKWGVGNTLVDRGSSSATHS